jgi:hypothetical protein
MGVCATHQSLSIIKANFTGLVRQKMRKTVARVEANACCPGSGFLLRPSDLRDLCVLLFGSPFRPMARDLCTEDRKDHKDFGSKESVLLVEPLPSKIASERARCAIYYSACDAA